ncbi:hypothetical protein Golomagni_07427, partial [Golovinomyces magnicellulatus]
MADKIPVWLDCDPGHDDVFAMIFAAHHPRLNLLGISTVFGNASLEHVTRNAASILTAIGKTDIPLYAGEAKALERPAVHAPDVHGESGLDGTELLPVPEMTASSVPAIEAMAAALKAQPKDTAWIVATGSTTNVGALFRKYPELVSHIKGLSIMGGSVGDDFSSAFLGKVDGKERIGNITPFAEFNIIIDPEAASEIFTNKELASKTILIPLDVTHQVLATSEVHDLMLYGPSGPKKGPKSTLRLMLVELLYFFGKTYMQVCIPYTIFMNPDIFGISAGPPLHDPLAVAAILSGTSDDVGFSYWDAERSQAPEHEEHFDVKVLTEGTFEAAKDGSTEMGRTVVKEVPQGQPG